jgi:hypothetical protein
MANPADQARSARSRNAPFAPDLVLIAVDLLLSFVRGMGSVRVCAASPTLMPQICDGKSTGMTVLAVYVCLD